MTFSIANASITFPFDVAENKYARSGDVRIAYQITGDAPVDVVWAPGTMSHLDLDWEIPQRALFFERFSKILPPDSFRQTRHRSFRSTGENGDAGGAHRRHPRGDG